MVEMGYEGRALAFHHCAHLSEMDFEYVEVVAIWGYVFVDINVVNENLAPFLIFFSLYLSGRIYQGLTQSPILFSF